MFGAAACTRVPEEGKVEGGDLLDRLRDAGEVKIGVAGEVPFGYIDENGEVTGEAPAIAKVIFPRLGVPKVKAVPTQFSALIPGLTQAQQFDVVSAGMYINPVRCEQVLFSDPDYLMPDSFIVRKGNPHGIKTYKEVADKKLKFATGTAYAEIDYAKAYGIKDMLILPDQVAGLDAVRQGRVDAFAGTAVTVRTVIKERAGSRASRPSSPSSTASRPTERAASRSGSRRRTCATRSTKSCTSSRTAVNSCASWRPSVSRRAR